ncbi:hypothetical protein [Amycolatopsis sp. NPDC004079]|uniref:hypothetical protein n=1 Tax=Amycolatopsis sp. NPDC004079 TaxID=3154549 RepID=UPI0033B4894A
MAKQNDHNDHVDDDQLGSAEYASRFLDPDRAELDLWMRGLFRGLGWTTAHRDIGDYGELWQYPGSFAGQELNPIDALHASGIEPMEAGATAGPTPIVHLHTCGVHNGCPDHRSVDRQLSWDSPELPAVLRELQQHADALDTGAMMQCWAFGSCGRTARERPW